MQHSKNEVGSPVLLDGLPRADVLHALFQRASGRFISDRFSLLDAQRAILDGDGVFYRLNGVDLRIRLTSSELLASGFDLLYGDGAGGEVVAHLLERREASRAVWVAEESEGSI